MACDKSGEWREGSEPSPQRLLLLSMYSGYIGRLIPKPASFPSLYHKDVPATATGALPPVYHTLPLFVELLQLVLHGLLEIKSLHHAASPFPLLDLSLDFGYDLVNLRLGVIRNTQERHLGVTLDTV